MKLRILSISVLAAAAVSIANAQLAYTNEGSTSFGGDQRSNLSDQAIFADLGSQTSFTLASLPGLTFNDISGTVLPTEFAVGNNGSFQVSAEIAFIYRNADDTDTLDTFGLAGSNNTIFSSANSAGLLNTVKIDGMGSSSSPSNNITFLWKDLTTSQSATQFDTAGVKLFASFDDALFTYYIAGDEDRKGSIASEGPGDFNDFDFIIRVNNQEISFTPVPEPATWGWMGVASLLGLVSLRRYKKSAVSAAA